MEKVKETILKAVREKHRINYKGIPIKLSLDFSTEILQIRRERQDACKVLKGKKICNLPNILSFRIEEERKNFSDKQKLKEYSNTKLTPKEILISLL